ncbi:MAG TPA: two-component sensor histidine kinase, partial [Candidatus Aquiluna sp.]|nr:two-component sensor histidine kinase [Aquiluna sp.]
QSPISQDLDLKTIPDELRVQVRESAGILTYTPVSFFKDGVLVAGITVGAPVVIPLAGNFELFLVFDLSAEQQSLALVQNAITVAGIILL